MSNSKAIVTLALGERYASLWRRHCEDNWSRYAERHGYDVICIEEPLDSSERAARRGATWQKLLVLGQPWSERYERIVWLDADILMNPAAPCFTEGVPAELVGGVDEYATPTPELYAQALRKLYRHWDATGATYFRNETAAEFYELVGLPGRHAQVLQCGMLVLSPHHHRAQLEDVYRSYEDTGPDLSGEMRPLSYELLEAGSVAWVDPRFNYPWLTYKALHHPFLLNSPHHPRAREAATAAFHDVHCLHFAGGYEDIVLVDRDGGGPARERVAHRRAAAAGAVERLRAPVALFAYARPDTTRQVLDAIRRARPEHLLVIADAPPPGDAQLGARSAEVRALVGGVDWDCDLRTAFADEHMGLRRRVETGLDWVFECVEEAIVLEDDCIPHPAFFRFCDDLLARYRDDQRVTSISGDNFDSDPGVPGAGYRFSRYPLIWGWATWRRAWQQHDPAMARWPELRRERWLESVFDDRLAVAYWAHHFDLTYDDGTSWDYAWVLSSWLNGGLSAVPDANLVTNVGFRADATHTRDDDFSPFANLPVAPVEFPLHDPPRVASDPELDAFLEDVLFSGNLSRMLARVRRAQKLRRQGG